MDAHNFYVRTLAEYGPQGVISLFYLIFGCFRLANWDALTLLDLVRVGMTVVVEP